MEDDMQTPAQQAQDFQTNSSNYMFKTTQVKITTMTKSSQSSQLQKSSQMPQKLSPVASNKSQPQEKMSKPVHRQPIQSCQSDTGNYDFCIGWLLLTLSESDDKGLTGDEPYTTTLKDVHSSLLHDYRALFPRKKVILTFETFQKAWNTGLEEQSRKKIFVLCQPNQQKVWKEQKISKNKTPKIHPSRLKKYQPKLSRKKKDPKKKRKKQVIIELI